MKIRKKINKLRIRRKIRVRSRIRGTKIRPRLSVFRSHRHTYAQLIDDLAGKTLASVSSHILKKKKIKKGEAADEIGKAMAEKAKKLGISKAIFDRGSYRYHGRVKMLVEAAKKAGLHI